MNKKYNENEQICKCYERGLSSNEIAKKYGISYPKILEILRSNNLHLKGGKRKISVADEKIICNQYKKGIKVSELAGNYNVASVTIRRLLKSNGIVLDRVRAQTKFTQKEENKIIKEYHKGNSAKVLSKKYQVHEQTIGRILKRNDMITPKNKISSQIEDMICKEYQKNISTDILALKYDVTRKTILKYLKKNYIKLNPNPRIYKFTSPSEKNNICNDYITGLSTVKIGKKYNMNSSTVNRILRRNNIQIRPLGRIKGGINKIINSDDESVICKKYDLGATTADLGQEYRVNPMTIHNILKSHNINIRKRGEHIAIFSTKDKKQICNLYKKGLNSTEIANIYNCNPNSIRNVLDKHGIERRDIKGENNPNWKDGASNQTYKSDFDELCKEKHRELWNRKCGLCYRKESENIEKWDQKLQVHHINYNKKGSCKDESNLFIPLCKRCHAKTNYNRRWWKTYLTNCLMIWGRW